MCADLIKGAKDKQLKVKGPVRLPTKVRACATQPYDRDSSGLFAVGGAAVLHQW